MRKGMVAILAGTLFLAGILLPGTGYCKKGGIGNGGGYSEDGSILYHSHSSRSYSGKDSFKGQGKALGRNKDKANASTQSRGNSSKKGPKNYTD